VRRADSQLLKPPWARPFRRSFHIPKVGTSVIRTVLETVSAKFIPSGPFHAGSLGLGCAQSCRERETDFECVSRGRRGIYGSVVVEELLASGSDRVVVLDDLSTGHANAVVPPARLVRGDIADGKLVTRILREEHIDTVIHLAASSSVGESMIDPGKYYVNNVVKGLALLDCVVQAGVRRFVFSSTAAVYGEAPEGPISESNPLLPTNPYGETKVAFEKALSLYRNAYGLEHVSLRYFNAAGATLRNGEQHIPETHLIPLVLAPALGRRRRSEQPERRNIRSRVSAPAGTAIRFGTSKKGTLCRARKRLWFSVHRDRSATR
jgi:hypothetical protein